jgi:hypothetical protein
VNFSNPSQSEAVAMAKAVGIAFSAVPGADRRLPTLNGVPEVAREVSEADLHMLVLRAVDLGREQGVRAFAEPIDLPDAAIDEVLSSTLGSALNQRRWLELVGRPAARAILAAVNGTFGKPVWTPRGNR